MSRNLLFNGKKSTENQQAEVSKTNTETAGKMLTDLANKSTGLVPMLFAEGREITDGIQAELENGFKKGLNQIELETRRLDYNLGAVISLIEFLIFNFKPQANATFMTHVLWNDADRAEMSANISRASLGYLSLLIGTRPVTTMDTSKPPVVTSIGGVVQ